MIVKTVKLSEKGQIAIPQDIRTSLGLEKGDELLIIEQEGKILIQRVESLREQVDDDFKDLEMYSLHSLKDIWDNEEDDIWSTYL